MANPDEPEKRRRAPTAEDLRALGHGTLDALIPANPSEQGLYTQVSAERIYRLFIEQMREGAVTVPLGVDTIVYCNRSFSGMVRDRSGQIVGGSLRQWLSAVDGPPVTELYESDESLHGDYRLHPKEGNVLPVSISAISVQEDAQVLRCLIVNDLRTRRDVERLEQVRAELEQSHQRKNEFLAMLGHELRNPLAPVRQAVELLHDHAKPDDPPYLARVRDVLARQVDHLHRLVGDLLDVGRVTKGTLVVERESMDLAEAIAAAHESVQKRLDQRNHQVTTRVQERPMQVFGDTVRLTQVFTNLLSNAAKYTHDGGSITIEAAAERQGFVVTVTDDGRGIEAEVLPYLFEPFVQSEATLDRSAGGIGVGLTLVRRIVELHDGTVTAASEGAGRGSRFEVWLPAATSDELDNPEVARAEAMATPAARRLLVVDDNEDAAEMLALVLRKRGYEVDVAYDGEQALRHAAEHRPEVILLDIGLPGIDGYEVARRLRADRANARCTLIALTGYGQAEDKQLAKEAGFDHHLVKPASAADLLRVLRPRDG